MGLKKQEILCCVCGRPFETDFQLYGGFCCSWDCRKEYEWRKTLYTCGETYYLNPSNKIKS